MSQVLEGGKEDKGDGKIRQVNMKGTQELGVDQCLFNDVQSTKKAHLTQVDALDSSGCPPLFRLDFRKSTMTFRNEIGAGPVEGMFDISRPGALSGDHMSRE